MVQGKLIWSHYVWIQLYFSFEKNSVKARRFKPAKICLHRSWKLFKFLERLKTYSWSANIKTTNNNQLTTFMANEDCASKRFRIIGELLNSLFRSVETSFIPHLYLQSESEKNTVSNSQIAVLIGTYVATYKESVVGSLAKLKEFLLLEFLLTKVRQNSSPSNQFTASRCTACTTVLGFS